MLRVISVRNGNTRMMNDELHGNKDGYQNVSRGWDVCRHGTKVTVRRRRNPLSRVVDGSIPLGDFVLVARKFIPVRGMGIGDVCRHGTKVTVRRRRNPLTRVVEWLIPVGDFVLVARSIHCRVTCDENETLHRGVGGDASILEHGNKLTVLGKKKPSVEG